MVHRSRSCRNLRVCAGGGFTLVELLVVIGIIAILIGVLLPVLSAARKSSDRTKCLASMRQIGHAFMLYSMDNKSYWPVGWHVYKPTGPGPGAFRDKCWYDFIAKYLIGPQKVTVDGVTYTSKECNYNGTAGPAYGGKATQWDPVFIGTLKDTTNALWGCPAWRRAFKGEENPYYMGYAMNWYPLAPNDGPGFANVAANRAVIRDDDPARKGKYYRAMQYNQPAQRALIVDAISAIGIEFSFGHLDKGVWPYQPEGNQVFPNEPVPIELTFDFNRHGRRKLGNKPNDPSMNMLYCDGHADTVSCRQAYKAVRFR